MDRIEGRDGGEEIMEARKGEKGKGEKGNKRESRGSTAFRSI